MENRPGKYLLVILVVVLALANVWLVDKTFFAEDKSQLPQMNFGLLSAGSFVIQNPAKNKTDSFNETRNILVLGRSGGQHIAPDLTDTIAVAHLDGSTKKIKVISIPRDLVVKTQNGTVKINSLYSTRSKKSEKEGLELIKNKVEEISGLVIDSFLLFDLDTAEKVINAVGGLNVYVKNNINDTRFPTDAGGYETFRLEKGLRYLDGETALKFVRTRNSSRGDFDRMERQQEVLKAIKGKIVSLNPVWDFPKIWNIFSTVKKNIRTDLTLSDIKTMWGLAKNLDLEKIETLSLNPENGLVKPEKMKFGSQTAYVLTATPQQFDYANIQKAINSFLEN
ncbi:MAG: LCP family protein [Candidatus Sungbacteria bacterium]|uniref:LCP family protein n=1 Tax=Candidatus Sungiibacteriota bacterium TaxID=2750080 RepID=A0A9D6DQU0_9BACT|nr:LCP family protein [Candidatus Sungbacteria bacterium]